MTPEARHERIGEIFLAALKVPDDTRRAAIVEACEGDDSMVDAVCRMLEHRTWGDEVPSVPIPAVEGNARPVSADLEFGDPIGAGGMGIVYDAVQRGTGRRVAVKVVRAELATESTRRRFERESHLLAHLHHPHIAQVFDAGTVRDRGMALPCIVMERVVGLPLGTAMSSMPVRAKVAMVATIADALQHAHQRGIMHRDLKPANILVDEDGWPKILDFGIARLVDRRDDTMATQEGQLLGTLPWMSPEQVAGLPEDVDTRTDIRALGLIAYELIAGRHPIEVDGRPLQEIIDSIVNHDPPGLMTIVPDLDPDIAIVVEKAMARDPDQRYDAASAFASDLRRALAGDPVTARPPTFGYRLRKGVRRHRALVATGLAIAILLVVGTTVSAILARRAVDARDEARRELRSQQALTTFFVDELLMHASPNVEVDREITLREVLDRAAARIDSSLRGEPHVRSRVREAIGRAYMALDEGGEAERHLDAVVAHHVEAFGPDDPRTWRAKLDLVRAWALLSRHDEVQATCDDLLRVQEQRLGLAHPDVLDTTLTKARSLFWTGAFEEAMPLVESVLERASFAPESGATVGWEAKWLFAYGCLLTHRLEEGEPVAQEVVAHREEKHGVDHAATLEARDVVLRYLLARGDIEGALPLGRTLLEDQSRVMGPTHFQTINTLALHGGTCFDAGLVEEGRRSLEDAIARRAEVDGDDHPSTNAHRMVLGRALLAIDDAQRAHRHLAIAARALHERPGPSHPLTLETDRCLALAMHGLGRSDDALALIEDTLARYGDAPSPMHANALLAKGRCLLDVGRGLDARDPLGAGVEMLAGTLGPDHPDVEAARALLEQATRSPDP